MNLLLGWLVSTCAEPRASRSATATPRRTPSADRKEVSMIARTWSGWTTPDRAERYRRHYEDEVSGHLRGVPGFRGARLLRREEGESVIFSSITFFDDLHAV